MTGFVASGSLAVLLHHLEEILTLLFFLCQFQVKLLHQCDTSLGQIVGDTQMCHLLCSGGITLVVGPARWVDGEESVVDT